MSDNIVSRLREGNAPGTYGEALRLEAADEIERLRAALVEAENRLEAALLGDEVCRDCVDVAWCNIKTALAHEQRAENGK